MATDKSLGVKVTGAKELRAALKAAEERDVLNDMKAAHFAVGNLVVGKARSVASGRSRAAVVAAETLRAGKRGTGATVTLGSAKVPFALGQEFGAQHGRPRTGPSGRKFVGYNQFPLPARNNPSTGFLYPALKASRDEVIATYLKALDEIIAKIHT